MHWWHCVGITLLLGIVLLSPCTSDSETSSKNNTICRSPSSCEPCQQLVINCRDKWLRTVPIFVPFNATGVELTLANNLIGELTDRCFTALNDGTIISLTKIDLSENKISTIRDNAFDGLQNSLKVLILHVDQMSIFPSEALSKLTSLTSLSLINFNTSLLPADAFNSQVNMEYLLIRSCGLVSLQQNIFSSQKSLKALSLDSNHLPEIPASALSSLQNLETLNLMSNEITKLGADAFPNLPSLRVLDLSYNRFRSIDKLAFNLLPSLTNLTMKYCQLSSMMELSSLAQLQSLDLTNNKLSMIPYDMFRQMNKLVKLTMDSNQLTAIGPNDFNGLESSLQELHLNDNKITSISTLSFQNLKALHILEINNQNLSTTIACNAFVGLKRTLKSLSLRSANLKSEHLCAIEELRSLESLLLGNNEIEEIPVNTFAKLRSIRILEMSYNSINKLTQRQVHGLENNLTEIVLDNNKITSIDNCTFSQFKQLTTITIGNNPLICDCRLIWMYERLQMETSPSIIDCALPANNLLNDMTIEELTCNNASYIKTVCEYLPLDPHDLIDVSISPPTTTKIVLLWAINSAFDTCNVSCSCKYEQDDKQCISSSIIITYHSNCEGECTFNSLQANTRYELCVTLNVTNNPAISNKCVTASTLVQTYLGMKLTTFIIVVSLASVVFLVIILVLVACLVCRHKERVFIRSLPKGALPEIKFDTLPTAGEKTHVYSKTYSKSSENLSSNLPGNLSIDEHNQRIRLMVRSAGGNTLSVPNLLQSGVYLNSAVAWSNVDIRPVSGRIQQQLAVASGEYEELPDNEQYDQIPADEQLPSNGNIKNS